MVNEVGTEGTVPRREVKVALRDALVAQRGWRLGEARRKMSVIRKAVEAIERDLRERRVPPRALYDLVMQAVELNVLLGESDALTAAHEAVVGQLGLREAGA